jgi:NAD-dependent deacetylase
VRLAEDPRGVPLCDCAAPLKPDVVLFGEHLPFAAMEEATRLAAGTDVLLCIGTSLEVWPVAGLAEVTTEAAGSVAIVTQGPTPFDAVAAVKLTGDVVEELEALLAHL